MEDKAKDKTKDKTKDKAKNKTKDKSNYNHSIKRKLRISYIIVFLIPLILSIVVYCVSALYINKYTKIMVSNEISATSKVIDNLFSKLNDTHFDIQNSDFIYNFSSDVYNSNDIVMFQNELSRECAKNNDLFYDIHIVFNDRNYVVSSQTGDTIENYFDANDDIYYENFSNWKSKVSQFSSGVISKYKNGVMYTKTIQRDGNNSAITMIIFIPTTNLVNLVDSAKVYGETSIVLLDSNNNTIFHNNKNNEMIKYIVKGVNDYEPNVPTSISYKNKHFIANKWQYYSLNYLTVVGENAVTANMKYLLLFIILFIIGVILLGNIVMKKFVNIGAKPIENILEILNEEDGNILDTTGDTDELAAIEKSILNRIDKTIKTNTFIVDSFVASIIKGNCNKTYLPISFSREKFQILLIYFAKKGVFEPAQNENINQSNHLINTAATNIMDEVLEKDANTYYSTDDNMLICLANTDKLIDIEKIRTVYHTLKTYFNVEGYVAISTLCNNLDEIPAIYKNVSIKLENMQLSQMFGVRYSENSSTTNAPSINPKYSEMFTNSILNANYAKAEEVAGSLISDCAEHNNNIADIKFYLILMFNKTNNDIKNQYNMEIDIYLFETNFTNRLIEINTPALIYNIITEYINVIKNHMNQSEITDSVEKKVALFIRDNYSSDDINLKIIADKFNITPAYLSQKFKQQFGVSVLDYLSNIRIENAKIKLKENKHSTKEIGEMCGFTNTVTFNRQFKETVGTTPGRYRQSL